MEPRGRSLGRKVVARYLGELLQEEPGEVGMVPRRGQLTHHSSGKGCQTVTLAQIRGASRPLAAPTRTCLILLPSAASKLQPGSLWKSSHSRSAS